MFDTVLIANRGEIACRIQRSARALGLRTVAVFSDADRGAPHVLAADQAVRLGPAPARESYLRADALIEAALVTGAGAVHPGYGFLSEDAGFARAVEAAGLVFVGPTPRQLELFGAKHTARALAEAAGVPLLAGTGLLVDTDAALAAAEEIGYPVMVKATGGGGGIGMAACHTPVELKEAFERVERIAANNFGSGRERGEAAGNEPTSPATDLQGVFLERLVTRARHVEVQVFGDGAGRVLALGDRDCSLQRRNQKVLEEAPAPGLAAAVRERLHATAAALCASVDYRSAGTVEFVYDADREEAAFLEVNARLQVEHPVTEEVTGLDLVAWMLRLARGEGDVLPAQAPPVRGHSVEVRVYAEDPAHGHRPAAGLLTRAQFPADAVRVETWVADGTEVSTAYDPMLAKLVATGADRADALDRLAAALAATRLDGVETNLALLRAVTADATVRAAAHDTGTLAGIAAADPRIEVLRAGTLTTVQDWPGRLGQWEVGVPPSGPMDDLSFRAGNRALGNPEGAPGLECTLAGPALRVAAPTWVCVTGADVDVTVEGRPVPMWEPVEVPAGAVLDVGTAGRLGLRTYVLVGGGLDVPPHGGSAATFTLGQFGGHGGRALAVGDVLRADPSLDRPGMSVIHRAARAPLTKAWRIAVTEGPHAAPEFFTHDDIEAFYAAEFEVHFNSARTGVRLVGPKPRWTRPDGGEAGLHPSNIHDTPYSVGAVDFTGDVPIVLGPDGPSLGGFVCPATVVTGERWKLGQLRPGDTVRFVPVDEPEAGRLRAAAWSGAGPAADLRPAGDRDHGVLARREPGEDRPAVTYRRSGDDNVLVEYGEMTLDLGLRMRVHALAARLAAEDLDGVVDVTPGIRSLQVHVDPDVLSTRQALGVLRALEEDLPATGDLSVPSRTVHLPLSWDDPATREAIERYVHGVRADAPWCRPAAEADVGANIEFIRRANGLADVAEVRRIVYAAEYLVLGLGDVYLGAPVATPLDPRHRLVTTKYNPARTWTAENSVGIGGAYLCIYGMEGPGGYQFVGRTTQVWRRYGRDAGALLRHFDRIRWYPVSAEELLELRADTAAGRHAPRTEDGLFSYGAYRGFLAREAAGIAAFRAVQAEAFGAERAAWAAAGEFDPRPDADLAAPGPLEADGPDVPPGGTLVEAPGVASVWRVDVRPGDEVTPGQPLVALEAMKMETLVAAPAAGVVAQVLVEPGRQVRPGTPLVVIAPAA